MTAAQLRSGNIPVTQISQIQWKQANVFDSASYAEELKDADAVVHSLGTIFENEKYKRIVNGEVSVNSLCSVAEEVKSLVWRTLTGGAGSSSSSGEHENPLKRAPPNSGSGSGGNSNSTSNSTSNAFQKLNRESAVILAQAFSQASKPSTKPFVYISAEDHNKFAPAEYIHSKRLAEAELDTIPYLRTVFLRPGFMVQGRSQAAAGPKTVRDGLGALLGLKYFVTSALGVAEQTGSWPVLDVETVAKAVIEAVGDETLSGPIGLAALNKYATSQV